MATIFSDSFAGPAGTISGRLPDTPFTSATWQSNAGGGGVLLNGAGGIETEGYYGPPSESSSGSAYYDFSSTALNPTIQAVEISFSLTMAASLQSTGSEQLPGLDLSVYCSGLGNFAKIYAVDDAGVTTWYLRLGFFDDFTQVDITAALAPAATYDGKFTITDGAQSITFAGTTVSKAYAYYDTQYGLQNLELRVGGFNRLESIALADAVTGPTLEVRIAAPSPLGAAGFLAFHDFSSALGDVTSVYAMDLITPGGPVRVPVSSWQATLQITDANYVQCVVPACGPWLAALGAATAFVIYRRAVLPGGQALEYEMARAPAEQQTLDRGPERYTCTLSGYSPGFAEDLAPPAAYDRALVGVRSVSSGTGGTRVRCAVDWLLRPGHRAFVDGVPLVVAYINYYAPTGFDAYMDVGSRT